jgi:hypothetical protein
MIHLVIPVLMAMAAYGMTICMHPEQALHWLRVILGKLVPERWALSKPLYSCQRCMVSLWGLSFCWMLGLLVNQEQAVVRFAHLDLSWWMSDLRALLLLPIYCILAVCVHGIIIGETR